MPRQAIELGTAPTGQGGDTNRQANTKINAMTAELYAADTDADQRITALEQSQSDGSVVSVAGIAPDETGNVPTAGLAAALAVPTNPADIGAATAAQGAKADTALQPVAGSALYPDTDRTKLAGIAAGAQVNAAAGTQAEAEAGTGTNLRSWSALRLRQAAAAWYASAERVLNRVLAGFVTTTNSSVTAADTLIVALGKLQAQLNALPVAELYRRSNILGTVSQLAGVPTGAIIERGSNANGEYVRFADGTQICSREVFFPGDGARETYVEYTWPAVFANTKYTVELNPDAYGYLVTNIKPSAKPGQDISRTLSTNSSSITVSGGGGFAINVTAIGRWF